MPIQQFPNVTINKARDGYHTKTLNLDYIIINIIIRSLSAT